jgi:Na+-translocating ferredoxin:NAD+ oxidoreductase subunit B
MAGTEALIRQLDAVLPQTQCTQCGYAGCLPYAQAMAAGEAAIDRCPPGGSATVAALAALLECSPLPINPACGTAKTVQTVVRIDEAQCIGCTLCIKACPVDAIVGAAKRMHTVIEAECTGCDLCLPACPVDCIAVLPATAEQQAAWAGPVRRQALTEHRRERHHRRQARLQRLAEERERRRKARLDEHRQAVIAAALARAGAARRARALGRDPGAGSTPDNDGSAPA